MLAAPLVGLYKKQSLPLCYAALLMFVLHLGFAILTSAYEAVWDRYIVISFYPYLVLILVCAVNLLLQSGAVERSIAKLPVAIRNQLTIG